MVKLSIIRKALRAIPRLDTRVLIYLNPNHLNVFFFTEKTMENPLYFWVFLSFHSLRFLSLECTFIIIFYGDCMNVELNLSYVTSCHWKLIGCCLWCCAGIMWAYFVLYILIYMQAYVVWMCVVDWLWLLIHIHVFLILLMFCLLHSPQISIRSV